MKQIDLAGVVLSPAARTLDFSALAIDPRTVLAVLHEPTNRFIFAAGRSGLGYASIAGSVMTLALDTSDLASGPLTGFRDDGADIATDARLEACRALIATGNATLSNLSTALGTPSDAATGSDAAAGSLIAKVTRLLGTQTGIATVLAAIRDRLPVALVGGRLSVDGSGVVQPVTVGNFPATQSVSGTVSLGAGAAQIGTIGNAFALDATAQSGNASTAAIAAATGTSADAATASGVNTTVIGALRAIRDRLLGTLTVSGTVTSNQGAAGASAWKIDGSGVTQPVSAAALPLPAGAATAAKQPALGTAGAPSADVLTVQGSAAGTPIPTQDARDGAAAPGSPYTVSTATTVVTIDTAGVGYIDNAVLSLGGMTAQWQSQLPDGTWASVSHQYLLNGIVSGDMGRYTVIPATGMTRVAVVGKTMRLVLSGTPSGSFQASVTLHAGVWSPPWTYVAAGSVTATLGTATTDYASAQIALSTSAQVLIASGAMPNRRTVKNTDASVTVFVGGPGVTASTGFPINPGESLVFDARGTANALYGVAASGAPVVATLGF